MSFSTVNKFDNLEKTTAQAEINSLVNEKVRNGKANENVEGLERAGADNTKEKAIRETARHEPKRFR